MMVFALATLLTLAVAGDAPDAAPADAAPVATTTAAPAATGGAAPAAETRRCIDNRDIRARDTSATHGYFVRTAQGWWRNTGPACPAFAPNRPVLTVSNQNRQCHGDLVTIFDPLTRIDFGSCVLGDWVRVDAPPKD